jgi:hypothetical protein
MYGRVYLLTVPLILPMMKASGPAAILQIISWHPISGGTQFSVSYIPLAFGSSSIWNAFSFPDFFFFSCSSETALE